MTNPNLILEKAERVKALARNLDDAVLDLMATPNSNAVRVEYEVTQFDIIGQSFPVPRLRVKLQEVKTL